MLKRQACERIHPRSLGADKWYDTKGFVSMLRSRKIAPHVAQNTDRRGGSAIDGRTTRHGGVWDQPEDSETVGRDSGAKETGGGEGQVVGTFLVPATNSPYNKTCGGSLENRAVQAVPFPPLSPYSVDDVEQYI